MDLPSPEPNPASPRESNSPRLTPTISSEKFWEFVEPARKRRERGGCGFLVGSGACWNR